MQPEEIPDIENEEPYEIPYQYREELTEILNE
jgi:hypothetical protein